MHGLEMPTLQACHKRVLRRWNSSGTLDAKNVYRGKLLDHVPLPFCRHFLFLKGKVTSSWFPEHVCS